MKALVAVLLLTAVVGGSSCTPSEQPTRYGDYIISEPFTHKNLSVFFLRAKDRVPEENFLTLAEALERKTIVVHETGEVGELSIDNLSEKPVFIHAGDIVKGGRQDRLIRHDFVVQPGAKELPLPSFCVEQGRWSQRGVESADAFESSKKMLASKELKLASKFRGSQREVWAEVAGIQEKLNASIRGARISGTSLELALEDKELGSKAKEYIDALTPAMASMPDVVGYVFATNGEINSADIYRSHDLFTRLWPKLIEASAVEALATQKDTSQTAALSPKAIARWLEGTGGDQAEEKVVNDQTTVRIREDSANVLFETYHKSSPVWVHRNIIKR